MNALIQISTDTQGASVVSARELHEFLEVKDKFAQWFSRRVDKYGLIEGQDFEPIEGFSQNGEKGGRPETDYALTLDCAKELSMVQNNPKGKEARQYFIEAEKQLRQVASQMPALTTSEQLMLQLVQQNAAVLANQQVILERLQSDIADMQRGLPAPAKRQKTQLTLPLAVRESTPANVRGQITKYVNAAAARTGNSQQFVWNYLYNRLHHVYGFDVYQCPRGNGETWLDVIERYSQLDRLYTLTNAEEIYSE